MRFENDMLYLSLCALNNIKPSIERVEKMDLDKVYESCQLHKITALVCYALEKVIVLPKKWKEAKASAIRRNVLFDIERQKITDFMDKKGIKYMPLKGIILKGYYPKVGMREMSDNDIFYDITFREQLEAFMLSIGYNCTERADNHDVYEKLPIYNFEMHHSLFLKEGAEIFYRYYLDIDKRMIKHKNNLGSYHLSNEDFYIYIIAHEYKHFSTCGTGIRSLLDCLVLLNNFEKTLDWKYINQETEKIGLADFEKRQRDICKKLIMSPDSDDFTKTEVEMLNYFVLCGVHGNYNVGIVNQMTGELGNPDRKITLGMKVKYIFKRLFPPMEVYKTEFPFFYRHKFLIPFCIFYRLYKLLFKNRDFFKTEMEILKNSNKTK